MRQRHRYASFALLLWIFSTGTAQERPKTEEQKEPEEKPPAILKAKPVKIDAKDDELTKLLKARYNEAVAELNEHYRSVVEGRHTPDVMLDAGKRVVEAGLELIQQPSERIALLEKYVELTKIAEEVAKAQVEVRRLRSPIMLHRARYDRLDAEIQLLRTKRKLQQDKVHGR